MDDHIGKPFDISYLVEVLRKQCGREPYRPAMVNPMTAPDVVTEDGLDVEGAIQSLGGDRTLYVQILRAFLAELEDLPNVVAQHLAAGERMDAKRTLHTLKGTAATIGAMALSETARMGEADVMDGQPATDGRLLEVLREAAHKTLLQMAPFAREE
jgi:HPt (histidine-containing phosphotransfer) domain-containing protein